MSDEKIKHLEFIQDVITRMNANSFLIKQWMVTLVSAILAVFVSTDNNYFILAAIFPAIVLWFLDSFYLMQERRYRGLYNDVAGITENPKVIKLFEMRPDLYTGGKYSFFSSFFSKTILLIYLLISIGLLLLFITLNCL